MSVSTKQLDKIKAQARELARKDADKLVSQTNGGLNQKDSSELNVKSYDVAPHQTLDGQKDIADFLTELQHGTGSQTYKSQGQAILNPDGKFSFMFLDEKVLAGDAGATTGAGAAIPVAFETAILEQQELAAVIYPLCLKAPMASNEFKQPRNTGGVTVAWVNNDSTASIASSDPTLDQFSLSAKSVRGLTEVARNADKDTNGLLARLITTKLGQRIAQAIDAAILRGTTSNSGMAGISNLTGRSTIITSGSGTFSYSDLTTAWKTIGLTFRANARWVGSGLDTQILQELVDGDTRPLWLPQSTSGIASPIPTAIFGKAYLESDQIPENLTVSGVTNTTELYLGDFGQYVVGEVGGLEISVSDHVKFAEDLRVIKAIRRMAGNAIDSKAFRVIRKIKT